jgi:preprotein translocase subunit SecG
MDILIGFHNIFSNDFKKDGWKNFIFRTNICLFILFYLFILIKNFKNEKNKNYITAIHSFSSDTNSPKFFQIAY